MSAQAYGLLYGFLTAVFGVHLGIFGRKWGRSHNPRHLWLTGTFAALAALYACKLTGLLGSFHPGANLETALRAAAIACSAVALKLFLRERRARV